MMNFDFLKTPRKIYLSSLAEAVSAPFPLVGVMDQNFKKKLKFDPASELKPFGFRKILFNFN